MKRTRERLGLNQVEFAKILGMSQQALSRIEFGKRKETKIHKAMIRLICIIIDSGNTDKIQQKVKLF